MARDVLAQKVQPLSWDDSAVYPRPPAVCCRGPRLTSASERTSSRAAGGAASVAPGDGGGGNAPSTLLRKAKGRQVLAMEKRRAAAAQAMRLQEEQQREAEEVRTSMSTENNGHPIANVTKPRSWSLFFLLPLLHGGTVVFRN